MTGKQNKNQEKSKNKIVRGLGRTMNNQIMFKEWNKNAHVQSTQEWM